MKKIIFFFTAMLLLAGTAFAQQSESIISKEELTLSGENAASATATQSGGKIMSGSCAPATNLTAAYNVNCGVTLTWQPPVADGNLAIAQRFPNAAGLSSMYDFKVDDIKNGSVLYQYQTSGNPMGEPYGMEYVNGYLYMIEMYYYNKIDLSTTPPTNLSGTSNMTMNMTTLTRLSYDYSTNTMYELKGALLRTIVLETGATITNIGNISGHEGSVCDMAIDLDGNMYLLTSNGNFYTINKATAVCTYVGNTGITSSAPRQAMAFDRSTGVLYWSCNTLNEAGTAYAATKWCTINPATGVATLLEEWPEYRIHNLTIPYPPAFAYNIYRDGTLVAENVTGLTYTDADFVTTDEHTWEVSVVCEDGSVSAPVSIALPACEGMCPAPTNLTGAYGPLCDEMILNWNAPASKSNGKSPYQFVPNTWETEAEKIAKDTRKEEIAALLAQSATHKNMPAELAQYYTGNREESNQAPFRGTGSDWFYSTQTIGNIMKTTMAGQVPGTQIGSANRSVQCMEYLNGQIYAVDYSSGGNTLGTINMTTGAWQNIATSSCDAVSLCWNPVTDDVYVTPWCEPNVGGPFGKINLATGAVTTIATFGGVSTNTLFMAIDNDGVAYAIKNTTNQFGTVNLATGEFTQTGTLPFTANFISNLTIDRETNELYWIAKSSTFTALEYRTYKINKANGALTLLYSYTPSDENQAVESCASITETGEPCDKVASLTANVVNNNDVALTWPAAPGSPTGYQILFNGTSLVNSQTGTSYTHTNVIHGTHNYCVKALYTGDCIPQSECTTVTVYETFGNCAGVVCGTGTATPASYFLPFNAWYRYSYSQQIFDAEEIGSKGEITHIAFNYFFATPDSKVNQTIYLGHTTKSTFSGTTDWIPLAELTPVFTGTIPYNNANEWFSIELDEPFVYEGGNLVLVYLNNNDGYVGSNVPRFYSHTTTGNKAIHYYKDGTPAGDIDPTNPPTATTVAAYRNNTRFVVCPNIEYNVFRDGEYIATVEEPTYTDVDFDAMQSHTWKVMVACEEGGFSSEISFFADACAGDCEPASNLQGEYELDCSVLLTWDAPAESSSSSTGVKVPEIDMTYIPMDPAVVAMKEQMMNNTNISNTSNATLSAKSPAGYVPAVASAAREAMVIVDQTGITHTADGGGLIATRWATSDADIVLADDFTLTEPWSIETVTFSGFIGINGQPPVKCAVIFYQNNAGIPGAEIVAYKDLALTGSYENPVITLPSPLALEPGTYWIGLMGVYDVASPTSTEDPNLGVYRYNIYYGTNTGLGANMKLMDATALFGMGTNWLDGPELVEEGNAYCMHFKLEGTLNGDPCPVVSNLTATVVENVNVALTWTAASGSPTNYQIFFNDALIATQTATSYTHTEVPVGNHTYSVKAIYPETEDCFSLPVTVPITVQEYFGNCVGVVCGEGATGSYQIPMNFLWHKSYVQQIYDASEIGDPGVITNIAFQYIFATAKTMVNQTIYIGHTNKSTFSGNTDWISIDDLTPVYTGDVTFNNEDTWFNLELQEPFVYEGGNLVVAYLSNNTTWTSSAVHFNTTATSGYKTIHFYQDNTNINPADPPTASGTLSTRANTRFIVCPLTLYNVYRNGELIAENHSGEQFPDTELDYTVQNTWTVRVVCENGGESLPIVLTKDPCIPCQPAINPTAYYNDNCCAIIEWEVPAFKKTSIMPQENSPVVKVDRIEEYHTGETVATDRLPAAYANHYTPVPPSFGQREFADAYVLNTFPPGGYSSLVLETGAKTDVGPLPTFETDEMPSGEDWDGTAMYRITNFGRVFSIAEPDGAQTLIGTVAGTTNCIGLAWDWVNKDGFYFYDVVTVGSNSTFSLYKLSIPSLTKTLIGAAPTSTEFRRGLALHADGSLYSITTSATVGVNSNLLRVNPANGQSTTVGTIGFPAMYGFDMVFDRDANVLYASPIDYNGPESKLITLNTTTGASTVVYNYGLLQHSTLSTTKGSVSSGDYVFNIYRDDELIESNYSGLTYEDCSDFDKYVGHTWTIVQACAQEEFDESEGVSVSLKACDCYPATNLNIVYDPNCDFAELSWDMPIVPNSDPAGVIFKAEPTGGTAMREGQAAKGDKSQALKSEDHRTVAGATVKKNNTVQDYPKVEVPKAPRGMVNVTLEAHYVWGEVMEGDQTGYQLLLDQTATQYGNTIPAVGAIYTNCSAPANLYDVFSHKIPTNADPSCTSTNIVANGSVTIQIPAGTYDWCIVNPTPGDRLWIAGSGDGSPGTSGRRDDFVFEDGLDYHFLMFLYNDGEADGVIITTTTAADPNSPGQPANVTVTPIATMLRANVAWTNPTTTFGGEPLTSISKVVIERDGVPVHEITSGVTVGGNMTWNDNDVPNAGDHCYGIYAVNAIGNGAKATDCATFGSFCDYIFIVNDSYGDGWNGGSIGITVDGVSYGTVTSPSGSGPTSFTVTKPLPSGVIEFSWNWGEYDDEVSFKILTPEGEEIFDAPLGYVWDLGNGEVFLTYEGACAQGQLFNIYRDGVLIEEGWGAPVYEDYSMNPFYAHCWEVRAVCTGDGHSESSGITECRDACKDLTEYIVFGKVESADGCNIVGANVVMENVFLEDYVTTTFADGRFEINGVFIATYEFTVTATGYLPATMTVEVNGHTNLGTIILYAVPYPPTNVTAAEVDVNSALVTWGVPATAPQPCGAILGYKVWRFLADDKDNELAWVQLNNTPIDALQRTDFGWASLATGDYQYAVRTCYTGIESEPAFSNVLAKRTNVVYTIHITTDNGASPAGAAVTLTNTADAQFTYTGTSGNTGVSFPAVRQGDYNLNITLDGYTDHTEALTIMEAGSHNVELISIKYLVTFNVTDCNTGDAVEGAAIVFNGVALEGYTVNAPAGTYPYVITKDGYNNKYGNATVADQPLTVDVCLGGVGINELPEGDFILYPNPATSIITVERATDASATIEVYNAMGMHIDQYETLEAKFEINVSQLAAGTYFVRVTEGTSIIVHSFVKK